MKKADLSDERIIEGLKNKEKDVFSYLYSNLGGKLMAYVLKNSGTEEDATELVHLTILTAWQNVNEGKYSAQGKFGGYFYMIGVNKWLKVLRSRKRSKESNTLEERSFGLINQSEEELLETVVRDQRIEELRGAFKKLGDLCREIIQAYYYGGEKLKEIAAGRDWSLSNAKQRMYKCREKLKKMLNPTD